MDVTAKDISEWARQAISDLSKRPEFETLTAVYRELSRVSGLSESWIAKFYQYAKQNPTQDTLDRLASAIKEVEATSLAVEKVA